MSKAVGTLTVKLAPKIEGCDLEKVAKIAALLKQRTEEVERLSEELSEEPNFV